MSSTGGTVANYEPPRPVMARVMGVELTRLDTSCMTVARHMDRSGRVVVHWVAERGSAYLAGVRKNDTILAVRHCHWHQLIVGWPVKHGTLATSRQLA